MKIYVGELRSLLNEALKKSDVDNFVSSLENAAGKINSKVSVTIDASSGMFNVFAKLISGDPSETERALGQSADKLGWTLLSKSDKRGSLTWWFEPKHSVKGAIPRKKLPATLWHATHASNVPSILEVGLVPRKRSFEGTTRAYEPRVYLASDPKGAYAAVNNEGEERLTLLKIDVSKAHPSTKFYVDQEFGYKKDGTPIAVYTLDAIPPSLISLPF